MKTSIAILLSVAINLSIPVYLLAASGKCTVIRSEGNRLVLECKEDVSPFPPGTRIKFKTERSGGAVEGC